MFRDTHAFLCKVCGGIISVYLFGYSCVFMCVRRFCKFACLRPEYKPQYSSYFSHTIHIWKLATWQISYMLATSQISYFMTFLIAFDYLNISCDMNQFWKLHHGKFHFTGNNIKINCFSDTKLFESVSKTSNIANFMNEILIAMTF